MHGYTRGQLVRWVDPGPVYAMLVISNCPGPGVWRVVQLSTVRITVYRYQIDSRHTVHIIAPFTHNNTRLAICWTHTHTTRHNALRGRHS